MTCMQGNWLLRCFGVVAVGAATGVAVWAAGGTESAPPPDWDAETLELFSVDARSLLGPGRPGGALPTVAASSGQSSVPAGSPGAPAGGGSGSGNGVWSRLISPESLEAEIKASVADAAAATKSPTEFNSAGHRNARVLYSTLAVLFGVIDQYDGDVRWKNAATGLRKMYSQAGFNCKVSSDPAFKEAKLRSDDLATLVRGGSVDLPNADPHNNWPEVANRPPLMTRMEQGIRGRLGAWTANKAEMSKNRDAVIREAQLLAVLAEVMKDADYEFGDDDGYLEYTNELQQQALTLVEAAKSDDQERAQATISLINKTCDSCHGDYRG